MSIYSGFSTAELNRIWPNSFKDGNWDVKSGSYTDANDESHNATGPEYPVHSALFININGHIFPVSQALLPGHLGCPPLYFLGFIVQGQLTSPLFTDHVELPQGTLILASIVHVGVVQKFPCPWLISIYTGTNQQQEILDSLVQRCIGPVQVASDANWRYGAQLFQLDMNDTQFSPWELGDSHNLDMNAILPIATSEPGAIIQAGVQTDGCLSKRARSDSLPQAGPSKKTKRLSLDDLKVSCPQLHTVVVWAKGYYRTGCLLEYPCISDREQKLNYSELAFTQAKVTKPYNVTYPDEPSFLSILDLVATEHSVFRRNSLDRTSEVIREYFPEDLNIPTATLIIMLENVFFTFTVDNFLALKVATSDSNPMSQTVECPLAHPMVGSLLRKLFEQKLRNCDNIMISTMAKRKMTDQQPLPAVTVGYALSLLLDGFINRYRHTLASLPTQTTQHLFTPRQLESEIETFKFDFLCSQWRSNENSQQFGSRMQAQRRTWRTSAVGN